MFKVGTRVTLCQSHLSHSNSSIIKPSELNLLLSICNLNFCFTKLKTSEKARALLFPWWQKGFLSFISNYFLDNIMTKHTKIKHWYCSVLIYSLLRLYNNEKCINLVLKNARDTSLPEKDAAGSCCLFLSDQAIMMFFLRTVSPTRYLFTFCFNSTIKCK